MRINYLDYWCEAMRDPTVEGTQVKVRYDPFDVSVGFAYIDRKWRKCDCPSTEFAGCSERELQLLTEELRKRNRITYGREQIEMTQKQLATFRRENTEIEASCASSAMIEKTRAALIVLEGGKKSPIEPCTAQEQGRQEETYARSSARKRTIRMKICSCSSGSSYETRTEEARVRGSDEPDRFPTDLLTQPAGARQEYFEQRCLIEHPRLSQVLDHIVQTICPPGEGASMRRPRNDGPGHRSSRVGKTTLIRFLEERLFAQAKSQMERDPSFIPFASITAAGPRCQPLRLAHLLPGESYADFKIPLWMARSPESENASCEKRWKQPCSSASPSPSLWMKPIILAKTLQAVDILQNQLDHLKYFENLTGVSHLLVGTYELRPFRKVNAQLACRSVDVHFSSL